jgi:hypothetical protein
MDQYTQNDKGNTAYKWKQGKSHTVTSNDIEKAFDKIPNFP